jgi:hypothetical protein
MPGAVDSNVPMVWDLVDGVPALFGLASWGGIPALMSGSTLDRMERIVDSVELTPHPGHGIWIEAIIPDEGGAWYGYYHHEAPAEVCGRIDRAIPRIAAAKSVDRGRSWQDLGVILESPESALACGSSNRFVLGGVGDVSAMLAPDKKDVYLFVSQYAKDSASQGVAVARLAWADRDEPSGRVTVWQREAWIPARRVSGDETDAVWEYPIATPLRPVSEPWHDGDPKADAFWGPSVHWNTYLGRYVMLLNRAKNESFDNEGIYVSYARDLSDPTGWSIPQKLMNGGGWYPQIAGLEPGVGTDKVAGQRARFLLTGRSDQMIEFQR